MNEELTTLAIVLGIIHSGVRLATPYIYAAIGETFSQRSGVLNLGVDGIMLMGAFFGFYAVFETGSPWLGVLAAAAIGALMAEEWNLPEQVVQAIKGHHGENGDGSAEAAVKLVSHLRYLDDDKVSALKDKCVAEYHMDAHRLDEMIQKALEDASQFRM